MIVLLFLETDNHSVWISLPYHTFSANRAASAPGTRPARRPRPEKSPATHASRLEVTMVEEQQQMKQRPGQREETSR